MEMFAIIESPPVFNKLQFLPSNTLQVHLYVFVNV